MKSKDKIKANGAPFSNKVAILGTYEGECADATITNKNGLDITVPVWENVFNSDDYKQAIELGWYIGFLGHPEDPNCMDFEHGCIVMTEGHIDPSGKVYGKFNLIDTPVGRVVKAFQDAGVKFGISVRGAGDIVDNSVDPDTFVFRGFDLVTFPAFPESIPEFSEIAASTDLVKQAKYKAVCTSVKDNLKSIKSAETLHIIKSQFAAQSDEYKAIEAHEEELFDEEEFADGVEEIERNKVQCVTRLYLEQVEANEQLRSQLASVQAELEATKIACARKLKGVERITSAQMSDIHKESLRASKQLESRIVDAKNANLKYKHKIDAAESEIQRKDSIISSLRTELDETVRSATSEQTKASNLDAINRKLKQRVEAMEQIVAEYQNAYGMMYANALGINLENITVTATTSVKELKQIIGSSSVANSSNVYAQPEEAVDIVPLDEDDPDNIVTI